MYTAGWRDRLQVELKQTGTSRRRASLAAGMHGGWVSELLTKGKEPTIVPFARMCIETGMRMGFILTGEGGSAKSEEFAALFEHTPADLQDGVLAMMRHVGRSPAKE